jgi:peptide/nickel transport system ATP-binding protein
MRDQLLIVKNLSVSYRSDEPVEALKDVNFSLKRGEIMAVLGESGSGKSTLAYSIMQLHQHNDRVHTEGYIAFDSKELFPRPECHLSQIRGKQIGFVFQDPLLALNPVFTVGSQLAEMLCFHLKMPTKQAKDRVLELLEKLDLKPSERIYKSYPHELSGGMRQRVMIALAVVLEPALIIADEPTFALDASLRFEIISLMMDMCTSQNSAMLLITHDINIAANFAHSLLVLHHGQVVEAGAVEDVLNEPNSRYTQSLIKLLKAEQDFMIDRFVSATADGNGCVLSTPAN